MIVDNYYWIKAKDTHYIIEISKLNIGYITIGKFIGESNFNKGMFLFEIIGNDIVQDLEDWEVIRKVR